MANWAMDRNTYDFSNTNGWVPLEYLGGCLAESWEVPDPLTFVLHVRKNVKWQDKPPVNGRDFTADDVAWNFERYRKDAWFDREYLQFIESIKVLDKYTVELKVQPPGNVLMPTGVLTGSGMYFLAKESVGAGNEIEDWKKIIGTGPFILEDYVAGSAVTFKKNPNYWGFDERYPKNRLPYADGVKVLLIGDTSTLLSAVRAGRIDQQYNIQWQDAESLKKTNPDLIFRKVSQSVSHEFAMKVYNAPFTDVRVRQALNMAIDRRQITSSFYNGNAQPYSSLIKQHFKEYTPYDQLPDKPQWTTLSVKEVLSYNPEKAKKLLLEAGYPNGFKTEIVSTKGRPAAIGLDEVVQFYLRAIGVDATINMYELGTYNTIRQGRTFTQVCLAWISGYSVALKTLGQWADPEDRQNNSMVVDPVYQKMYREALQTFDEAKRSQIMHQMDYYSLEQSWFINLPEPGEFTVWQPWLGGYSGEGPPGPHYTGALLSRLWVDQTKKAARR